MWGPMLPWLGPSLYPGGNDEQLTERYQIAVEQMEPPSVARPPASVASRSASVASRFARESPRQSVIRRRRYAAARYARGSLRTIALWGPMLPRLGLVACRLLSSAAYVQLSRG